MQKPIYSTLYDSGFKEHKNDSGSNFLSAEMYKTYENVGKILRVTITILGKKFRGYAVGNFSDFERHERKRSTATDYNAVDDSDKIHRVMIEVEPLLEALRSIIMTLDEFPCHCLLQTWWYPGRNGSLVLI